MSELHTPLPWKIEPAATKKGAEIVGANGETVARLTDLDMENAELIVESVNRIHVANTSVPITDQRIRNEL